MKTPARVAIVGGLSTVLLTPVGAAHAEITDRTPPTVTVTHRVAELDGWHRATVPVRITATDRSGLDGTSQVTLSGASSGTYDLSGGIVDLDVTADGTTTIDYAASDLEGNTRLGSATIRLDATRPLAEVRGGPASGVVHQGQIVDLTAGCEDATSASPRAR